MLQFKNSPVSTIVPADWLTIIVHANISIQGTEFVGAEIIFSATQNILASLPHYCYRPILCIP